MSDPVTRRSQREGEVGGMTEKGGVPLLRLPVWRIPKHGRVGESCDLSFLPSSGMLLVIAGMSRQRKAPKTRGRREGVQVDHDSQRALLGFSARSHNLRNPLRRRYYFQRFPPTICSPPSAGLPLEVVEMIIARHAQLRLFFELLHRRVVAVPHIHHTLIEITQTCRWGMTVNKELL